MTFKVFIIPILLCWVQFSQSKEFPKEIPRCRPTDEPCVVKVINDILKNHPNGFPELNLGNIDPYKIGDIKISGDPSKPVNFNLEMTDLSFTGYYNMNFSKFSGLKMDPKDLKIDTEAFVERTELKGKYKVSGKMLVLPITGEGDVTCIIDGLHIKTRSKPKVELRDGKEYLKVDNLKAKAKADHMTIKLTNLFNGDKVLGESMIKILNENWKVLWDEMEPSFSEQLTKANGEEIDKILNSFPYKDLFIMDE